jgi:hypothetical protein
MSHLRRLCALVAVATLTFAGLTVASAPAQAAAVDPRPVAQAAAWLTGQLHNGLIHNDQYDFDDYGLSIDTALALDTVGGHDDTVATVGRAVRDHYYSYTSGADFGSDDRYAGATAKALVLAQVAGTGPAAYRATAVQDLEARVSTTAPAVGRIEDSGSSDFANVIGQSFAARALVVANSSLSDEALAFLLDQQCSLGFFREQFTSDKSSSAQSCDASGGTPSVDATALAVVNLEAISGEPGVAAALSAAKDWLKTKANADGSFGDPENANTTGIVAWALGDTPESQAAAAWLRQRQADDADACSALAGQIGAVAFDPDSLAAGRLDGIDTLSQDQWRRSSSQALPALQYLEDVPDASLQVTGPTGFVAAGSTASYQVGGAHAASRICLELSGTTVGGTANGAGILTLAAKLPAGTADRTVTIVDADGSTASTVTHTLGVKTLGVTPAHARVHRAHRVRVVVSGLAPTELVTLRFRGVTVRTGHANSDGTFVRFVRVGHKLGKARIIATGEFPSIRHGRVVVRVVR